MSNTGNIVRLTILLGIVTLIQVLILNNIDIIPLCNPMLYVVFLLAMPFGTKSIPMMITGFVAGLLIDVASNTPGMHAGACVLACYMRKYILQLIAFRNAYKEDELPSIQGYGIVWYTKYALMMLVVHHIFLFFVEQYDRLFLLQTVLRIVISIGASLGLIILFGLIAPGLTGQRYKES
ncbi:MAG: rod shape-determining protein MreD [Bacteroidales bacterium]|nr:rod shape-determining protein MreD [Bacteroidales bacterium]